MTARERILEERLAMLNMVEPRVVTRAIGAAIAGEYGALQHLGIDLPPDGPATGQSQRDKKVFRHAMIYAHISRLVEG